MSSGQIQHLVVGIDFSQYSRIVVKEAKQMASVLKLPLTYVHVLQDVAIYRSAFAIERPHVTEGIQRRARQYYGLSSETQVVVKFGKPSEQILEVAEEFDCPLILIGFRGGHAISKFFIGSTAETLAFVSRFPVWIHRGSSIKIPKKIFIPSDFSMDTEEALKEVDSFAKSLKAKLQLHHVYQEPMPLMDFPAWAAIEKEMRTEDQKATQNFKKRHPGLKITRSVGSVYEEIQRRSQKFDLLALTPRRAGYPRPLVGGIMRKLIRTGDKPILVLP